MTSYPKPFICFSAASFAASVVVNVASVTPDIVNAFSVFSAVIEYSSSFSPLFSAAVFAAFFAASSLVNVPGTSTVSPVALFLMILTV